MKLNRILVLLILLLITTGCTVNYELQIEENGIFKETITGTVTNKELSNEERTDTNIYLYNLNSRTPLIRDQGTYIKDIVDKGDYKEFTFNYEFNNNYDKSNVINVCYEDVRFEETDDLYYIDLEGKFNCMYSDKIVVNVTSKYAVIENNADKVKDNTYTWIINDEDDADIYMAISKNVKNEISKKKNTSTFKIIGFIVLILLSLITYFLYKKKNSSEN